MNTIKHPPGSSKGQSKWFLDAAITTGDCANSSTATETLTRPPGGLLSKMLKLLHRA